MLVFTRKEGGEIVIADTVRIIFRKIGASRVKVGVIAPDGIDVLRGEVWSNERRNDPNQQESGDGQPSS
jgi:carbon storage regulator CsrA